LVADEAAVATGIMDEIHFLRDLVIVFGCAAPVVYLFHRLKQSPIVGFVFSGALIGPFGLSLIRDVGSVNALAIVGVMILLFSLGLEFSLKKLMETRVAVFITGPLQMAGTAIPVILLARHFGVSTGTGLIYGILIGVSSTTVLMKMLAERSEVDSLHGRISLGISIFQDLCTVPMIVAIPLLASGEAILPAVMTALGKAVAIIAAVVVVARYLFPVLLKGILRTRSKELFLITSIFMFLGTAWVTSMAGISLALGSFLAGLILSESEYGHQIFAEVRPFRDSLNSLFFISMGMLVDPGVIVRNLPVILGMTVALIIGKALVTTVAAVASRVPLQVGILTGVALAQIGEFSFILLQASAAVGLVAAHPYQIFLASSLLTMVLTPVVFGVARNLVGKHDWQKAGSPAWTIPRDTSSTVPVVLEDHVIICGFGVGGRNIAKVLKANRIPYIVLDLNAQNAREAREEGEPVLFGDCSSAHILEFAGIRRARVIVFAISDPFATRLAVGVARQMNRELVVLTRTKYVADMDALWDIGSTEVIAEEFEAALELVTRILRVYNAPRALVAAEIKSIRDLRFGIFRERHATVPRIRLSSDVDVYTETWDVPQGSACSGATVADSGLRSETGVLILGIIRENRTLNNPGPDERILSSDRLVLSGTKEQLRKAIEMLTGPGARRSP
jgi:CPA2 family monovalent cation:H+ antiporter-2